MIPVCLCSMVNLIIYTTCNKTLLNSNVGLGLEKLGLNKGICGCRVEMYVQ